MVSFGQQYQYLMNNHICYKRNKAEIGRFFAGIVAICFVLYIPLKFEMIKTYTISNNYAKDALTELSETIQCTGQIDVDAYERFINKLRLTGCIYQPDFSVGRRLKSVNEEVCYDIAYHCEIMDIVYAAGSYGINKGDLVTVRIIPQLDSFMTGIVSLFGNNSLFTEGYRIGWRQ